MGKITEISERLQVTDFYSNPAARREGDYDLPVDLGPGQLDEVSRSLSACPVYAPTPLVSLDKAAQAMGLEAVYYKDEGHRFGLKSFKSIGGAYAVGRLLQGLIEAKLGRRLGLDEIIRGQAGDFVASQCVATASAGNHGRAVAAGARLFGCRAVIFLGDDVSPERQDAVRSLGAEVERVSGTYDDAAGAAAETCRQRGWHLVSDASSPDYEAIPSQIMAGYGVIMREVEEQLAVCEEQGLGALSHVFLQAGVGTFSAAMAACIGARLGVARPQIIIVEPSRAACLLAAVRAGRRESVKGGLETMMGGLSCALAGSLSCAVLGQLGDHFMSLDDDGVGALMRALAEGRLGPPVEAGESGVVGLMGLLALATDDKLRRVGGLDGASKILLIGTEGASDPKIYRELTGMAPRVEADPFAKFESREA